MFSIDGMFALLNKQLYSLISKLYNLIISISEQKLVTNEMVESITERLFLIISVVMLFMLVYALLRSIINTDFLSKGDFSGSKIVLNFIKSIIIIVLVPSAFNLMYSLQSSILEQNVIGKVILGNENTDSVTNLSDGFSYFLFSAFFTDNDSTEFQTIEQGLINDNWDLIAEDDTISEITNGRIIFNGLAAAVAACVAIYILVVYAIDIAIRSVKLAFLHIIAPVPIIMSVIPSQDKAFKSWLKTVLSTFADIFIKLAILVFGFSIIKSIFTQDAAISSLFGENAIVKAFIILGILAFINKAPKLISDIFGISSASNFSIKDRWKDIKEGYNTVTLGTKPVNSTIGGIGGAVSAYKYHKKALKETNRKSSGFETLATLYTGVSRGSRYGMKFGKVTNDQLLNEKLWSNEDYQQKNLSQKVELAVKNSLRDNFGFKYEIDEELDIGDLALIERNSEDERNIEIMKKGLQTRIKEVKTKFNPVLKRNERAQNILKSKLDLVNSILKDENSDIKSAEFEMPLIKRSIDENGKTIMEISESNVKLNYHQMEKLENDLKNPNSEIYSLYSDKQRVDILEKLENKKEEVANKAMTDPRILERVKQFDTQLNNLSNLDSNLGNDLDGNNSYKDVLTNYLNSTNTYSLLKKLNKAVSADKSKIQMDTELADISDTFRFTIDGQEVARNVNGLTYDNELEFFNERIKERTDLKAKKDTALKSEVELFHKLHDSNPKNGNKN